MKNLSYANYMNYKMALAEKRRQLDWYKNDLANLQRAKSCCMDESQFDQADAMIAKAIKEVRSLETDVRALETSIRQFNFKPATVAC